MRVMVVRLLAMRWQVRRRQLRAAAAAPGVALFRALLAGVGAGAPPIHETHMSHKLCVHELPHQADEALPQTGGSNGATMRFLPERDYHDNRGLELAREVLLPVRCPPLHLPIHRAPTRTRVVCASTAGASRPPRHQLLGLVDSRVRATPLSALNDVVPHFVGSVTVELPNGPLSRC